MLDIGLGHFPQLAQSGIDVRLPLNELDEVDAVQPMILVFVLADSDTQERTFRNATLWSPEFMDSCDHGHRGSVRFVLAGRETDFDDALVGAEAVLELVEDSGIDVLEDSD